MKFSIMANTPEMQLLTGDGLQPVFSPEIGGVSQQRSPESEQVVLVTPAQPPSKVCLSPRKCPTSCTRILPSELTSRLQPVQVLELPKLLYLITIP